MLIHTIQWISLTHQGHLRPRGRRVRGTDLSTLVHQDLLNILDVGLGVEPCVAQILRIEDVQRRTGPSAATYTFKPRSVFQKSGGEARLRGGPAGDRGRRSSRGASAVFTSWPRSWRSTRSRLQLRLRLRLRDLARRVGCSCKEGPKAASTRLSSMKAASARITSSWSR